MKTKILILLSVLLIIFQNGYTQYLQYDNPRPKFSAFINNPTDARTASLGLAGYAASTPFATFYNSALTAFSRDKVGFAASYSNFTNLASIEKKPVSSQLSVGGFVKISKKMALSLGYRNYEGSFHIIGGDGSNIFPISQNEYALDAGFSYLLSKKFAISTNVRYFETKIDNYQTDAFAFDLNSIYKIRRFDIALGITNIGTKIKYFNESYYLPTRLKHGVSYKIGFWGNHNVCLTEEINYQFKPYNRFSSGIDGGIGFEYAYLKTYYFRIGRHSQWDGIFDESYNTAGLGLKLYGIELDFAYLRRMGIFSTSYMTSVVDNYLISLKVTI